VLDWVRRWKILRCEEFADPTESDESVRECREHEGEEQQRCAYGLCIQVSYCFCEKWQQETHVKQLKGTEDDSDIEVMATQRVRDLLDFLKKAPSKRKGRTYEGQDGSKNGYQGNHCDEERSCHAIEREMFNTRIILGIVQYLRSCPNGFDLTSSELSDLMCVECFPAVKLDEPDTLKHLRRKSNSFICEMHALLSLSEHDLDAYNLNGEADDKDLWVTAVKLSTQLEKETINLLRVQREPNSPAERKCKFEYIYI